jgi:WD40 repeat protein
MLEIIYNLLTLLAQFQAPLPTHHSWNAANGSQVNYIARWTSRCSYTAPYVYVAINTGAYKYDPVTRSNILTYTTGEIARKTIAYSTNVYAAGSVTTNPGYAYKLDRDNATLLATFSSHGQGIRDIAIDATGSTIYTGSNDCSSRAWSTANASTIRTFVYEYPGSLVYLIYSVCIGSGYLFAGGQYPENLRQWDVNTAATVITYTPSSSSASG